MAQSIASVPGPDKQSTPLVDLRRDFYASPMPTVSIWRRMAGLAGLAIATFAYAILSGSADIGPTQLWQLAAGDGDAVARTVVFDLRLPRVLTAFAVGALLALSGLLLQALFRNPLADPYVLGVSGGAAVAALLALAAGAATWVTQGAAVLGAAAAVSLVWWLGATGGTNRLLLAGVVIAATCSAIVTLVLSLASAEELRGMVFWLAGDLSWATWPKATLALALTATLAVTALARPLDVLASGELRAQSVGLDMRIARAAAVAGAALLAAAAVVSAGTIGFVGLLGPHIARLLFRTARHSLIAPATALLGGLIVALADTLARTLLEPRQLPVGALLALVGAPVFLSLLKRVR
jgi:iron complex transport system permease protein